VPYGSAALKFPRQVAAFLESLPIFRILQALKAAGPKSFQPFDHLLS